MGIATLTKASPFSSSPKHGLRKLPLQISSRVSDCIHGDSLFVFGLERYGWSDRRHGYKDKILGSYVVLRCGTCCGSPRRTFCHLWILRGMSQGQKVLADIL